MKLVIISHTPHYRRNGELVGWGPTIREIDEISEMFDRVVHIAPSHGQHAPESALRYKSPRVQVREVVPAGGAGTKKKLGVLRQIGGYTRAIRHELRDADAVHVRCPANISLVALIVLMLMRQPRRRWLKYAGNWCPVEREPWSYTFQRWLLRKSWHNGVVTVNGHWPNQPSFVHSFFNPCLDQGERLEGRQQSAIKQMIGPVRLIFVGRLNSAKGVARVLQIVARVKRLGGSVFLDLVGDGNERPQFEHLAKNLGIDGLITFHGWLPRAEIARLYSRAHLMILPSTSSEGWPKVLSEAMAYGVVPLASNISSIPQYLEAFSCGHVFEPTNLDAFVASIEWYSAHPEAWKEESENAVKAAESFDYTDHCEAVRRIFKIPLPVAGGTPLKSEALKA